VNVTDTIALKVQTRLDNIMYKY